MSERDKFLTEAMGECWHTNTKPYIRVCPDCDSREVTRSWDDVRTNFFSWQGMGKLREFYDTWGKYKQTDFRHYVYMNRPESSFSIPYYDYMWHKDNTANLMYGFLKDKK